MVNMKGEDRLQLIIYLIIFVAIAGSVLGLSADTTNKIIQWLLSIFVGILLSMVVGYLVEGFTGNILKKILITISITDDFSVSISAFAITTFIVKILLFGF